jgi:hypothetical protein
MQELTVTPSWQRFVVSGNIPVAGRGLGLRIRDRTAPTFAAQLELGATARITSASASTST